MKRRSQDPASMELRKESERERVGTFQFIRTEIPERDSLEEQ
jgi:hypothetical protein